MDEGLLNDLLECSVCLERLDTSSRVLPCQHTFCLKCLKEIIQSRKELRCPECRVPVEVKIEELPPNVLLMRILEGMKNSNKSHQAAPQHTNRQQARHGASEGTKQVPHARAVHDYLSKEPGDLSFKKGELIYLHKKIDAFWYHGECAGRSGVFPITYAQVVVALPTPVALCKALYDFRMSAPDEEGCLAFDKGAVIAVLRRVDDNWAEGRLDERVGIFPIAFVEMNHAARELMKTHAAAGRAVPPLPDQHSSPRPGHSDHRHHAQHPMRYQQMAMSTPIANTQNYQHIANMTQSHPIYHQPQPNPTLIPASQVLIPQTVSHGGGGVVSAAIHRNIIEPQKDLIQFANIHNKSHQTTMGVQSLNMRIGEAYDNRLRNVKFDSCNSTPVHKTDNTYQNVRQHDSFPVSVANFNAQNSSDSSSSVTTPSVSVSSVTSPPNTSTNSSEDTTEPSTPTSPGNTEGITTVMAVQKPKNTPHKVSSQNEHENALSDTIESNSGVSRINESSNSTNTSLNVSLPPLDSPKLNVSGGSNSSGSQQQNATVLPKVDTETPLKSKKHDAPSSSKNLRSNAENVRPNSESVRTNAENLLLSFSLSSQAALSPSHGKDGMSPANFLVARAHRDHHHREREKRNSLTPGTHLQVQNQHVNQNRHSAEILATSLLDHMPERDSTRHDKEREKDRRRRRSRSNDRQLPAAYVALYPYKPQKLDELELKKGAIYMVMERCQDGWFKGFSNRTQGCGVFPGNYVAPAATHARKQHDKVLTSSPSSNKPAPQVPAMTSRTTTDHNNATAAPPDAPPRTLSPTPANAPAHSFPWPSGAKEQQKSAEKPKEKPSKQEKSSGVSLMKRLAAMKKCKSPPPAGYSMDNPVFEDCPGVSNAPANSVTATRHPVHVRSGSCPSQLLQVMPQADGMLQGGSVSSAVGHRLFGPNAMTMTSSHRIANKKERPSVLAVLGGNATVAHAKHHASSSRSSMEGVWTGSAPAPHHQHRKSQSLDAGSVLAASRKDKQTHPQLVKERFRCIVPYPPNSEYELELRVDDIVVVHRKRGDGWYKGTLERTGRTGLFPASFVQSCET